MTNNRLFHGLRLFLRGRFNLHEDSATQKEVEERIESGVIFRGTNLWVLIFATFIASIGLNVNSTAVIIGAMLISPLMGPIMGIGLALGVDNFELLKRAFKNFSFMTVIAIMTSTIYFMISPWSVAQSELIARTQPTTWDVLIAFFGGLAGIVALSRKEKSITVIPGVAIATALMPPLCTAGFGIATGQFNYFFGAFYLFIINAVFIAIATFVVVGRLKYEKKTFIDPAKGRKVRRIISTVIFITIVPSIFIGYNLIREMIFKQNVNNFVSTVFAFEESKVVDYKVKYNPRSAVENSIEVILYGKPLPKETIETLKAQMPKYDIFNTSLTVQQSGDNVDLASTFIQANFEELIREKNDKIKNLETEVQKHKEEILPSAEISKEVSAILSLEIDVAISKTVMWNYKGETLDTMVFCYLKNDNLKLSDADEKRIKDWLKVKTNTQNIKLIY